MARKRLTPVEMIELKKDIKNKCPRGEWFHNKTMIKVYVIGPALIESTLEPAVAYIELDVDGTSDGVMFIRPLWEFMDGRFVKSSSNRT